MKIIALPHRTVITRARSFREFRLLQGKNYNGNSFSKWVQMWADWQEIKNVTTTKSTQNGN